MKIAHVGKSFVILVALCSTGCAMEASEPGEDDSVVATDSTPVLGHGERRTGPHCAPVIAKDASGNLYVKEFLCPMPSKPLPDPEAAALENQHGEWVSGSGSTDENAY